jgi:MoaA/NifB/PqqE/SkfB family radical SAM enzyme
MIGVSKLYCGAVEAGDVLRYRDRRAQDLPSHLLQFSADKKPVVVWNVTKQCNLKCLHCYAKATAGAAVDELSLAEGLALLADLKDFGVPVVLFSGGEPLMRPDLPELVAWTVAHGMRAVISTNGTLIDRERARQLRDLGLSYVGSA